MNPRKNCGWSTASPRIRINCVALCAIVLALPAGRAAAMASFRNYGVETASRAAAAVEPALAAFETEPGPGTLYRLRHSARVMAAALDVFYQAYPSPPARAHRRTLLEFDEALGAARDLDVVLEQLGGPFKGAPGSALAAEAAGREREGVMAGLLASIRSPLRPRLAEAAAFLRTKPSSSGPYEAGGEFWEKPEVRLEDGASAVLARLAGHCAEDIRLHGYSRPSPEALHILRAKLRALLSLLEFAPEKDAAPLSAARALLKRATRELGDVHDREVLLAWLKARLPRAAELSKAAARDRARLDSAARGLAGRLDSARVLDGLEAAWPGPGGSCKAEPGDFEDLRRHGEALYARARVKEGVQAVSLEALPAGVTFLGAACAFQSFRPELEAEGWVENDGLPALDLGRMELHVARPDRPRPRKLEGEVEVLGEAGKGISGNVKVRIGAAKYKVKNPAPPDLLGIATPNMEADLLANDLFRRLGFTVPETFAAYVKERGGAWKPMLLTRWLDPALVGEAWEGARDWHRRAAAEEPDGGERGAGAAALPGLDPGSYALMRAADVLIGNWDRHLDNWLVTASGLCIPLDHDQAFVTPSMLIAPGRDWYVNFTPAIPAGRDRSPNVYVDAAAPVGCRPVNGGVHRILRRDKAPIISVLIRRDPALLSRAARKVADILTPEAIRGAVDDIPLAYAGAKRRKELARILLNRRAGLAAALAAYQAALADGAEAGPAARQAGPDGGRGGPAGGAKPAGPAAAPGLPARRRYWHCHGRPGLVVERRGSVLVAFDGSRELGESVELEGPEGELAAVEKDLGLDPRSLELRGDPAAIR